MKIRKVYENNSLNYIKKIVQDYKEFIQNIRPFIKEESDEFRFDDFYIKNLNIVDDELYAYYILFDENDEVIHEGSISTSLKDLLMKLKINKFNI